MGIAGDKPRHSAHLGRGGLMVGLSWWASAVAPGVGCCAPWWCQRLPQARWCLRRPLPGTVVVPVVGQAAVGRIPPSDPRWWSWWAVVGAFLCSGDVCGKPLSGGVHFVASIYSVLQDFGVGVRPGEILAFAGDGDARGRRLPPWRRRHGSDCSLIRLKHIYNF
jgi:hypothetical protein